MLWMPLPAWWDTLCLEQDVNSQVAESLAPRLEEGMWTKDVDAVAGLVSELASMMRTIDARVKEAVTAAAAQPASGACSGSERLRWWLQGSAFETRSLHAMGLDFLASAPSTAGGSQDDEAQAEIGGSSIGKGGGRGDGEGGAGRGKGRGRGRGSKKGGAPVASARQRQLEAVMGQLRVAQEVRDAPVLTTGRHPAAPCYLHPPQ